ncbi:glycosyltransferase [Paucidesulfovibrio longus]|uniref:glycosyltransferase n=1 Tax=Paucidesulfovibrio longus TaxID=889 RepID=UPI0003B7AAB1|nr:glycosyltransferase [Paucidesulfovibrio longus]
MDNRTFRIDLHVHSKHSTRPSQWLLQKIGCPESFTEPRLIYETAKAQGMGLVTVTDHNTLAGSLEIAHLPDTFVSEEITTYFPEDKCKLHVLAFDITEAQHAEITRLRGNVFELVPWLREQQITHVLAHPLFAVNDRLQPHHFEKCLLLFNSFELNGTRDAMQNRVLREIIESLTRFDIERLADRHGIEPHGEEPWNKGLTGGSDDHSSLNIGRVHTELDGPASLENLKRQLALRAGRPKGIAATPQTMAHNLYGIAYQFYKSRIRAQGSSAKHICFRFADNALDLRRRELPGMFSGLKRLVSRGKTACWSYFGRERTAQDMMLRQATDIILHDDTLMELADGRIDDVLEVEKQWSRFVNQSTGRIMHQFAERTMQTVRGGRFFDIFHTVGSAGAFYALLAPYFVSYDLFSRERRFCDDVLRVFGKTPHRPRAQGLKVAHFTDTFDEVNGVARTIRQQVSLVDRHNKQMRVITCGQGRSEPGVKSFEPVGSMELPEYPGLTLHYPPLLDMLTYCFEQDFDFILAATPGPVGLAALAVSKILKIPCHGTYHTAFPQYIGAFTDDQALEDAAWRFMVWFYNQMSVVYAPSHAVREELSSHGIDAEKIIVYPRGVDTNRFHPSKRNGFFRKRQMGSGTKFLYVGRVSREKDLHVLCEAFRKVQAQRPGCELVVVGDGPYLEEMRRDLRGLPAFFTGVLEGEDLAQAYASADIFVFPSATDTFGNVVLEAQASGLPAIVSDMGGPQENIKPDQTGLIAEAGNPDAFARCMLALADYPERRLYMAKAARDGMEDRTFDATFLRTWEIFGESVRSGRYM